MNWQHHDTRIQPVVRHDWTVAEAATYYQQPLLDLVFLAQQTHRRYFSPNELQLSTLLNIKTGGCPEDCAYCPQSSRYDTGLDNSPLMDLAEVRKAALRAKAQGATRFCMGAAWRSPKGPQVRRVGEMVRLVKSLGLETCVTLGMLADEQAQALKAAGLDYYNHNLDTSPGFYREIISTRDYTERLATLKAVRLAGIKVCCGGIIGMGEGGNDRCALLVELANQPKHPDSVPINVLVRVPGTPLAEQPPVDGLELVRIVALARIMMPASVVRLSAGREGMSDELQALCFLAGANSVFYGEQLLTTGNPALERDHGLFERLGLTPIRLGQNAGG
ncbi:MAG: biotin synthase BioB [Gammaproteobacteria bacterium]